MLLDDERESGRCAGVRANGRCVNMHVVHERHHVRDVEFMECAATRVRLLRRITKTPSGC